MQINIGDIEEVVLLANKLVDLESARTDIAFAKGSQIHIDNTNGYRIGALIFDGDFWYFHPNDYGKTDD